ncbi:hypothetical protein [Maioricimonas sp. JC845]|uniref:hypothetical protein n=1 Tax=Maioricimonas sp. JC845 TaxID=3232138 RepID=UPI003457A5EF
MSSDENRHEVDPSSEMVEPKPVDARNSGPSAIRTVLYGGLIVAGGALMAVSAKPELASYVSFAAEKEAPTCSLSAGGSCCSQASQAVAAADSACCLKSAEVSVAAEGSCCSTISRFGAMSHAADADDALAAVPPAPPMPETL